MPTLLTKTNKAIWYIILFPLISWGQKDIDFLNKKRAGDFYFQHGKYNQAIENYIVAVAIDPSCAECKKKISDSKNKIKATVQALRTKYKATVPTVAPSIKQTIEVLKPKLPELVEIAYAYKTEDVDIKSFQIGKYEVTQKEYEIYCKLNNLTFPDILQNLRNDNFPIINISWNDAKKYAEWLTAITTSTYDLPSKAEWELAKSTIKDLKTEAWLFDNSQKKLNEVGKKQANNYGIYDIEGNVTEWVDDWFEKDFIEEKDIKAFFEDNENLKNRVACGCSFKDELFCVKRD